MAKGHKSHEQKKKCYNIILGGVPPSGKKGVIRSVRMFDVTKLSKGNETAIRTPSGTVRQSRLTGVNGTKVQ